MAPQTWDDILYQTSIYPEIDPSQYSKDEFKDKVVLITGSGRGIGKELGLAFASLGAKVCFTDLKLGDVRAAAHEAAQKTGTQRIAVGGDVRMYTNLGQLVCETVDKFGPVDVLINNAGDGDFLTYDIAHLDEYWDITTLNLKEPVDLTCLVLPSMIEGNTGTIICNTTMRAVDNCPFCIPYTIAKIEQAKLIDCLHLKLEDKDIRVFHIHPGTLPTKMGDPSYAMKPYAREACPCLKDWVFQYLPLLQEDIGLGVWTMVYLAAGTVFSLLWVD
jgi:NAD(P)-dependent dehydrogenase (short-subunit alcohol dehydrogenase family)